MLVRDSVPRLRLSASRYVCPICLSRGYATTRSLQSIYSTSAFPTKKSQIARNDPQRYLLHHNRPFTTTRIRQATGAALASNTSPLDNSLLSPSGLGFDSPDDVRAYLKKWSRDHQKSIQENAPEQVQAGRNAALPNSLFLRNNADAAQDGNDGLDAEMETADAQVPPSSADDVDDFDSTNISTRDMKPGAVLNIPGARGRVRPQLAIYLGSRGVQSLFFLSDGRWFADCRQVFSSHVVPDFATPAELASIEAHLPQKTIEYQKAEDGGTVPFTAVGEIPHADSRYLLQKLTAFTEEIEDAKRDYPDFLDQLYEKFADESEFKYETFRILLRDYLNIDMDTLTEGAKNHMYHSAWSDSRLTCITDNTGFSVGFMPKRMLRSLVQVTEWARSYQDAAARASTGKNVSEELNKNPLIPFISKARRLISKSRKIRLPTLECVLGPTLEAVRPPPGVIERRPTGEEFTEDEKKIIEFLWLVYVRRPESRNAGGRRYQAVASLIIRAIGAYPKFTLDPTTGALFLQELGCLDPWTLPSDSFVTIPHTKTGLHQPARLAREKTYAAAAAAAFDGSEESPLPDTMAHLRKDWGDLEVFCIDGAMTKVVDDGISIEPSKEHPDHHWIRVHIAHISAFVPPDSPILAQGKTMGLSQYHVTGPDPYIPFSVVRPYSLKANKPALTFSTLLSPDGTIKDINITPSIVRNIVTISTGAFNDVFNITDSSINFLKVGATKPTESRVSNDERQQVEQAQLIERHRTTLNRLKELVLARWTKRFQESDEHLRMLKLPNFRRSVYISPSEALHEPQYERIFRSEHVLGDLTTSIMCEVNDFDRVTYYEQSIKHNPVAGAMMLASETAALWSAARGVPVIYRSNKESANTSLEKLNSLGPHDFYIGLPSGESLDMSRNLALSMPGYVHVTSPLRRFRDLMNHHQIDAYLRAQAEEAEQLDGRSEEIKYPRSRQQLTEALHNFSDGSNFARYAHLQSTQWAVISLYRAFYFQESTLPKIWDVFVENPVLLGAGSSHSDPTTTSRGILTPLGIKVTIEPSEQGWEKKAKFRQFLPCKLTRITPGQGQVYCIATGPPSDEPHVKGLVYPEMQEQ